MLIYKTKETSGDLDGYRPGVCNIGKNEVRKRYSTAFVGFIVAGLLVGAIVLYSLPRLLLLLSFVPLFLGAEGFYQGHFKFCAGFAARSKYDFSGSSDEKGTVTDKGAHNLDMRKAMRINLYSAVTAAVLAAAIYLAAAV